jgi:hypothetical protein
MFKWLLADMSTSAVCKQKEPKQGAADNEDEKENEEPGNKRQKRAGKNPGKKVEVVEPVQVLKNGSERAKLWLDDVFSILAASFRDDEAKVEASENPDKLKVRLLRKKGLVLSLALQFCWTTHLTIKQNSGDKWSSCRTMLKAHRHHMHRRAHSVARAVVVLGPLDTVPHYCTP